VDPRYLLTIIINFYMINYFSTCDVYG